MLSSWVAGNRHFLQLRPGYVEIQRKVKLQIPRLLASSASPETREKPIDTLQSGEAVAPPQAQQPSQGGQTVDVPFIKAPHSLFLNTFRTLLKERTSALSSQAAVSLSELGGRLNKVTGYEHIEILKHQVAQNEKAIAAKRQAARDAKIAYETAVARRSNSQHAVNDFLQRKSNWTDADVLRLPALVKEDHLYEQEEARAKALVAETEAAVEARFNELLHSILKRYHEEQVWSDKIRSVSTYGSLLALGVNIVVFILAIIVVEPWKRKRLAETFEKRIEQLSLENREILRKSMGDIAVHFEAQKQVLTDLRGIPAGDAPVDHEQSESEGADREPLTFIERTGGMGRDMWIVGAIGAASGVVITILFGYLR
ncbi:Mdm33 family-domain-containing protein [Hysterangium stoloniferum]|nr:Mdm33 family-domain-containing protein [Hysterangium stoloniferum]